MKLAAGHPFARKYQLTFTKADGSSLEIATKSQDAHALDIKFDVTRALGQSCAQGSLSILGLSRDHIEPFTDLAGLCYASRANKIFINLKAGYFESDFKMVDVFQGGISSAAVAKPPEMWLHLGVNECWRYNETIQQPKLNYKENMYTINQIAKHVVGLYGYEYQDLSKLGDTPSTHQFSLSQNSTFLDAMTALDGIGNGIVCFEEYRGTVYAYPKDPNATIEGTCYADAAHGLLGVSNVNGLNCDITTFLQDADPHMCNLKVKSEIMTGATGTYRIIRKRFFGHYRGDEWYTQYFCSAKKS